MAEARRARPEAEAWLALLEEALLESDAGTAWRAALVEPTADRSAKAPLLAHSRITLDPRAVRAWVRRLFKLAPQADGRPIDGLALLEAALDQDDARLDALAQTAGADAHAVRVVAQMAVLPLLHVCAARHGQDVPSAW
ncbi:MAG TPA: hypothetical protein VH137_06490 [Gemmatimonadales bacterium]|nr:hypothetical protein [Gemmatimonadales bacterium]